MAVRVRPGLRLHRRRSGPASAGARPQDEKLAERDGEPVRRRPGDLDAAGRRRRAPARAHARRRAAEEHRRVHPGVLAGRPGPRAGPGSSSPSATGRGRATWRTSSSSATTTRRSTRRSRPLSVTPFSATSLERGLDGRARQLRPRAARPPEPTGSRRSGRAGRIASKRDVRCSQLVAALVARCARASDEPSADAARERLVNRLDQWEQAAQPAAPAEQEPRLRAGFRRRASTAR